MTATMELKKIPENALQDVLNCEKGKCTSVFKWNGITLKCFKMSQKHPGSSSELVKVIKEVWVKEISGEYCESFIYSMP